MILIITVLSLLVMQSSPMPQGGVHIDFVYDFLYFSIINGQYSTAVTTTINLENRGRSDAITLVVNKLLAESQRTIIDYAHALKNSGNNEIISKYFPPALKLIFSGSRVTLINKRDGMALKLEWRTDGDGDRGAYGDSHIQKEHARLGWDIEPYVDNNKVYFTIWNNYQHQYLKLEIRSDGDGDHKAFGSTDKDTWRHYWFLKPLVIDGETFFSIHNVEYNQPLKLGRYVDGDGDRRGWGHNGLVNTNPENFAWRINLFN